MNNIKKAREKAGLSQKQVAFTLKVSAPTVSEWESGKKNPSLSNLIELAKLYGVSADYLIGLSDELLSTPFMVALRQYCNITEVDFAPIVSYYSKDELLSQSRIRGERPKLPERMALKSLLGVDLHIALMLGCSLCQTVEEYSELYLDYLAADSPDKDILRAYHSIKDEGMKHSVRKLLDLPDEASAQATSTFQTPGTKAI